MKLCILLIGSQSVTSSRQATAIATPRCFFQLSTFSTYKKIMLYILKHYGGPSPAQTLSPTFFAWADYYDFSIHAVFFNITKTCLYNFDPLKPHFYVVKLGFTGVYIIFLISAQNIDCRYSSEPPRQKFLSRNKKNTRVFLSENFQFLVVKFSIYLNRRVFVMVLGQIGLCKQCRPRSGSTSCCFKTHQKVVKWTGSNFRINMVRSFDSVNAVI